MCIILGIYDYLKDVIHDLFRSKGVIPWKEGSVFFYIKQRRIARWIKKGMKNGKKEN